MITMKEFEAAWRQHFLDNPQWRKQFPEETQQKLLEVAVEFAADEPALQVVNQLLEARLGAIQAELSEKLKRSERLSVVWAKRWSQYAIEKKLPAQETLWGEQREAQGHSRGLRVALRAIRKELSQ